MDTLGSLVDKLGIVNTRMWNAQDGLYEIRRMNLEQFKEKFFNEKGIEKLFNDLNRAADLNLQRNNLIDEIDGLIIQLVSDAMDKKDLNKYQQKKHKSY
jgi:hypothetical protein